MATYKGKPVVLDSIGKGYTIDNADHEYGSDEKYSAVYLTFNEGEGRLDGVYIFSEMQLKEAALRAAKKPEDVLDMTQIIHVSPFVRFFKRLFS